MRGRVCLKCTLENVPEIGNDALAVYVEYYSKWYNKGPGPSQVLKVYIQKMY